jgi:amino acid transporter
MSESTGTSTTQQGVDDSAHLKALGYDDHFKRSMSLWANFALGFTYLSPLVGIYSIFALGLSTGGPPSVWWLFIVGTGQLLVALVFGEVVSQYPIHGGIYPWARRLWNKRYAWMAAWVYVWALLVTITAVAEYGSGFAASLFGVEATPIVGLIFTLALLLIALAFNFTGTKTLARVARIGLAAELLGVVLVGLYLMIFQRQQEFSIFLDTMGVEGEGSYAAAFLGAALIGLFLFYGFEACGDVAEEVENPAKRIPRAMILTILVGGVSAFFAFAGYVLAADDETLAAIVAGENLDPIPGILESTLGVVGAKIFLVIAITAFISCVLSLQAAASRLIYSFARDKMLPGHDWLSKVSARTAIPANAAIIACGIPLLICLVVYLDAEFFHVGLLVQVTSFAILGIYVAFQMVVLAALRQRAKGWKPAGPFNLGVAGGWIVNVLALAYGLFAIYLLAKPYGAGEAVADWIVLIGLAVVVVIGGLYLFIARPDRKSNAPEGDALQIAEKLRAMK